MPTYDGALELTWTNKHLRLLANSDGTYEWLPPSDYRVAEVRLLHSAHGVGEVHGERDRRKDNLLIRGDALNALTSLIELPEFAREYVGKVKLAYLDPPFNTQQSFLHYDDALEHSVWLTMMRDRLTQVKALLSPEGSVWVHCDDSQQHRLRSVLDEIFGTSAFVSTVVWQKRTSRDSRPAFSPMHDYIHVYAPSGLSWAGTRNRLTDGGSYSNPDADLRGPWRSVPLSAQAGHATAAQFYEITTPTGVVHPPPRGRCWTYTRDRFDALLADGRVYWPKNGNGKPRLKMFPEDSEGLVPFTIWPAVEVGENNEAKKQLLRDFPATADAFDTPKPERLIERVVQIGSNVGDVILDCFLGSGTTAAVAHKMGRRWIGVERELDTVSRFVVPRLTRVVEATDSGGITEEVDWQGGGGFRILDVAPSMFDAAGGQVYLSDWATNGKLTEATAAQLHYDFDPVAPFCGRRGRARLAVIDGLVNAAVVSLLVEALPEDERLTVCGTAVDPAAREVLKDLRPGSTVRKVPQSILREYRHAPRMHRTGGPTAPIAGSTP